MDIVLPTVFLDSYIKGINDLYLKYINWTVAGGVRATEKFNCLKDTPTAIFVVRNTWVIGVFEALFKNGLQITDDIAVVGFDDM